MAIDPSIPLQIAKPQDPLATAGSLLQLQTMMQQGQALKQQQAERQQIKDAFSQYGQGTPELEKALYAASPEVGLEYQGKMQESQKRNLEIQKLQREKQKAKLDFMHTGMASIRDTYENAMRQGIPPEQASMLANAEYQRRKVMAMQTGDFTPEELAQFPEAFDTNQFYPAWAEVVGAKALMDAQIDREKAEASRADAAAARGVTMRGQDLQRQSAIERTEAVKGIGGSGKPPAGYRWSTDGQTLEPIPGGPATTVAAETAGRIGLASSFLKDAPAIRSRISEGETTGPYDQIKARTISGTDSASVYRKIKSGTDALQRMLTGAGMPQQEAAQYASRYLPDSTDTTDSALDKFDQLVKELNQVKATVERGRSVAPPYGPSPEMGLDGLPPGFEED